MPDIISLVLTVSDFDELQFLKCTLGLDWTIKKKQSSFKVLSTFYNYFSLFPFTEPVIFTLINPFPKKKVQFSMDLFFLSLVGKKTPLHILGPLKTARLVTKACYLLIESNWLREKCRVPVMKYPLQGLLRASWQTFAFQPRTEGIPKPTKGNT